MTFWTNMIFFLTGIFEPKYHFVSGKPFLYFKYLCGELLAIQRSLTHVDIRDEKWTALRMCDTSLKSRRLQKRLENCVTTERGVGRANAEVM